MAANQGALGGALHPRNTTSFASAARCDLRFSLLEVEQARVEHLGGWLATTLPFRMPLWVLTACA
eukprot:4800610-Amphidinium_carterae.1